MSVVKAFIGGLIGAVIATAILMYLRDGSMRGYEWFPVITGLLTGLGTRVLTGSGAGSVATGAVAALISLVAILCGNEMISYFQLRNVDLGPVAGMEERVKARVEEKKVADDEGTSDASEDESAEDSGGEAADANGATDSDEAAAAESSKEEMAEGEARSTRPETTMTADRGAGAGPTGPKVKRPKSWRDFAPYVFSGLGVLLAYQLGRGSDRKVAVHHGSSNAPADSSESATEEAT